MSGDRRIDALVAATLAGAVAVESVASPHARGPAVADAAIALALAVPLAWSRRAPLRATAGVLALATVQSALLTPVPPLLTVLFVLLVCAYAVAAYRPLGAAVAGAVLCAAGVAAVELVAPAGERDLAGTAPVAAIALGAWVAGRAVRDRTRRAAELGELARRLELARGERERHAVAEERARVARELHDVVAHAMTVVCLQAAAAQRVWAADPRAGRAALHAVGEVARETLGRLREALDLLDDGDDAHGAVPALDDEGALARLAEWARGAGLNVRVQIEGRPSALGTAGPVAFRVVQEALTNAARHAAPADVAVRVVFGERALVVDVRDRGRRPGASPAVELTGSGSGLRGMRERVEACAGELTCGPDPAGGFAVRAHLPLVPTS